MTYRPRSMPARYMQGAPDIVRKCIIDIIAICPTAPLGYDVIFRQEGTPRGGASYGLDFCQHGTQGHHFYLTNYEMRAYRERNRRNRVAWDDIPAVTQSAIIHYLES